MLGGTVDIKIKVILEGTEVEFRVALEVHLEATLLLFEGLKSARRSFSRTGAPT